MMYKRTRRVHNWRAVEVQVIDISLDFSFAARTIVNEVAWDWQCDAYESTSRSVR